MFEIQKYSWLFLVAIISLNCNDRNHWNFKTRSNDSLILKIHINPAFIEHSEIILLKCDTAQTIQILLRKIMAVDETEDTFWFKKVYLTDRQYKELDASLISVCRQKTNVHTSKLKITDGIAMYSSFIYKSDTNNISVSNPSPKEDSIGYGFSKSLFEVLPSSFKDSVVTEYFSELAEYIGESKTHMTDPKRKIDQIRMKKYHWTIQKRQAN